MANAQRFGNYRHLNLMDESEEIVGIHGKENNFTLKLTVQNSSFKYIFNDFIFIYTILSTIVLVK